jgi:hypothetical protein
MNSVLSYEQFLLEGDKEVDMSNPRSKTITLNYADETMEGLRRYFLDKYMPKAENKETEEKINKCITTYVYTLDKKLKIDSKIVEDLGKCLGKNHEEMSRELQELTNEFYDGKNNVIS